MSLDAALASVLKPGQSIVIGQAWGAPSELIEALPRHLNALQGSQLFVGMLLGPFPHLPGTTVESFFPSGGLGSDAALARAGVTYSPASLYEVANEFRTGTRSADLVLAHGVPTADGGVSLALGVDFVHAAATSAPVTLIETADSLPWTGPDSVVNGGKFVIAKRSGPVATLQREPGRVDATIAENVAAWIPDATTIQLGMAGWVSELARVLASRRGLRIHTGLVSDWALSLADAGALDTSYPIRAASAAGTLEFYQRINHSDAVELAPADVTHAPVTLDALPSLIAVNSALEVDLLGNVNCEFGAEGRRGGIAGLADFARSASTSPSGLSIIALSAADRRGSRIVPRLRGPRPSLSAACVNIVATQFGSADLRGLRAAERARALASIADPRYRDELLSSARTIEQSEGQSR
jgi:acyl-CoA hydrolase